MNSDVGFAVLAALLAVSEALSFIPSIKSNGVFQMLFNILTFLGNPKGKGE
jgi:hypothetical protein